VIDQELRTAQGWRGQDARYDPRRRPPRRSHLTDWRRENTVPQLRVKNQFRLLIVGELDNLVKEAKHDWDSMPFAIMYRAPRKKVRSICPCELAVHRLTTYHSGVALHSWCLPVPRCNLRIRRPSSVRRVGFLVLAGTKTLVANRPLLRRWTASRSLRTKSWISEIGEDS